MATLNVYFYGETLAYKAFYAETDKEIDVNNVQFPISFYLKFEVPQDKNLYIKTINYGGGYFSYNPEGKKLLVTSQIRLNQEASVRVNVESYTGVKLIAGSGVYDYSSVYCLIQSATIRVKVRQGFKVNYVVAFDTSNIECSSWASSTGSYKGQMIKNVRINNGELLVDIVPVHNGVTMKTLRIETAQLSSLQPRVKFNVTSPSLIDRLQVSYFKNGVYCTPIIIQSGTVKAAAPINVDGNTEVKISCIPASGSVVSMSCKSDSGGVIYQNNTYSQTITFSPVLDCTVNIGASAVTQNNGIHLLIQNSGSELSEFTLSGNGKTYNLSSISSITVDRISSPYTVAITPKNGYYVQMVSYKLGITVYTEINSKSKYTATIGIDDYSVISVSVQKASSGSQGQEQSSSSSGSSAPAPTPSTPSAESTTSGIPPFIQYNQGSYYVYYVNTLYDTTPQPLLVTVGNQYGKNLLTWAPAPEGQTFKGWFTNNGRWISNSTTVQYDDGNYLYPAYEPVSEGFFSKYEWERGWAKGNNRDHMGDITIRNNTGKNIIVNKLCVPFWHAYVAPGESLLSAQGWMYYNENQLNNVDVDYEFWLNGVKKKTVAAKTRNGRIPGNSRGYTRIPPTWRGQRGAAGAWGVCEFYPWSNETKNISYLPTMEEVIKDSLNVRSYSGQPIPSGCIENISQDNTQLNFKVENGQVLVVKVYKTIAQNQVNGFLVGPFFMNPFTGSLEGEDPNMSHAFRCDKWIDWEYEDIAPTIAAEPEGGVTLEDTIKLKVTDDHGFNRTSFQYRNSQGWRSSGGTEIDFTFTNNIYFVEGGESTVTFYCCGSGYKKEGQLVIKTNVQPRFDPMKDTEICVLTNPKWDYETDEKEFKVSLTGTDSTKASFANGYCNQVRAIATIGDKTYESEWIDCPLYNKEYWETNPSQEIDLTDSFPDNINDFYGKEWTVRVEFRHISHSLEGVRAKELISVGNNAFTASGYTPIDPSAGELRSLLKDNLVYYIPDLDISKPRVLWSFFKNVTSEMKFICVNVAQNNDAVTDISSEQEGKFEYYWVNNNQMEQIIPDEGETITEKLNEEQFSDKQIFIAYKILDGAKKDAITNLSNKINTYDIETVQTLEDLIGQYLPSYIERSTFTSVDKYLQCTDQIYSMIRDFDNDQREKFQTIIDLISELLNTIYPNNVTLQATFLRVNPKEGEEDNKTSDCQFTNLQYKYLPYFIESDVITSDSLNGISIELDYDGITVESISSTYGYFKLLTQMGLRDKIEVPYMSMVTESGVVDGTVEFENLVKLIDFYYKLQELHLPGVYDPAEQPEPKEDIKKIHIAVNTDREGEVVPANALKITTTGGDIWWAWYNVEDHLVVARTSEVDAENHEIEYPAPVVVEKERLLKIKNDLANGIIFMIRNMF